MLKVRISMNPKAKASIRTVRGKVYNPSARGMEQLRNLVKKQLPKGFKPISNGVACVLHYEFPLPLKMTKERKLKFDGSDHITRPDFDNLCKFSNDALNGVLWDDDKLICMAFVEKSWINSKEGVTTLYVFDLGDSRDQALVALFREGARILCEDGNNEDSEHG